MVDFDEAINRLMDLRNEDGRFSPYPEEALTAARKLCEEHHLEESWRKPISLRIDIHTRKVIEVLSSIDPNQPIVKQAIETTGNCDTLEFSYAEMLAELKTGMFCKLVQMRHT